MTICDGKMVAIEYTLTFGAKEVIDSNVGKEPLEFKQGEHQIIKGLESELEELSAGDAKQIVLEPEDAYGHSIEEAVIQVPLAQLPQEVQKQGAMVQGKGAGGQVVTGQIKAIRESEATIIFNHPMAGKTLHFDIKILSVA